MPRFTKYAIAAAVLSFCLAWQPADAQALMRESACTRTFGSNTLTYDCSFNVKHYQPKTPVRMYIDFACTGSCGPVLGFGLRKRDFFTPEDVSGRLVGGGRTENGLWIDFQFESLKRTGKTYVGNAHFTIPIMVEDGSGNAVQTRLDADLHVKTE